ncbi:MAG: dihydrofolate reductase family protein [Gemmatimonadota bacterium]
MTVKCSVYIAASVDGFIAGEDGDLEWLHRPEYAPSELKGLSYHEFIATIDALVVGRGTFETVLTFGGWPYEGRPVTVLSSTLSSVPERLEGKVRLDSGRPRKIVSRLASEGHEHLYVDGGVTIQRFLAAGLIDEITITRIPIILGGGIPLFGTTGVERPLHLIDAVRSDSGIVQERYEVRSAA